MTEVTSLADLCTFTDFDVIATGGQLLEVPCREPAIVEIAAGCVNEHVETELACVGCLADFQMELAGEEPGDCSTCGEPLMITMREIANA